MEHLSFLARNVRFLSFGFLTAFFSSVGQTYYIAVFGPSIREEFGLSHGDFGGLYAIGTTVSALCLVWAGRLIDSLDLRLFTALTALCLIAASMLMSFVDGVVLLAVALFTLRFSGQGLMSHTAMTTMGRYFDRERGRAVAIALLGFPAGVALFPAMGLVLIDEFDWRGAWRFVAVALALGLLPLLLWLLRGHGERHRAHMVQLREDEGGGEGAARRRPQRQWSRGEVLRDPRFYLLAFATTCSSFVGTGYFFHHTVIADAKGWSAGLMASAFVAYTAGNIAANLATGPSIDRWSARVLMPVFLLPMGLASVVLAMADEPVYAIVAWLLLGITGGVGQTLLGAIWAELYGVVSLGGIKAIVTALGVLASAGSPLVFGLLFDWNVSTEAIAWGSAGYIMLASVSAYVATRWRSQDKNQPRGTP